MPTRYTSNALLFIIYYYIIAEIQPIAFCPFYCYKLPHTILLPYYIVICHRPTYYLKAMNYTLLFAKSQCLLALFSQKGKLLNDRADNYLPIKSTYEILSSLNVWSMTSHRNYIHTYILNNSIALKTLDCWEKNISLFLEWTIIFIICSLSVRQWLSSLRFDVTPPAVSTFFALYFCRYSSFLCFSLLYL